MLAIYATIVLTAALVGLHEHAESAGDVLAVLVVAGLTLFVAHTFSDLLSRRVDVEGGVPMEEIREVLIVKLPPSSLPGFQHSSSCSPTLGPPA